MRYGTHGARQRPLKGGRDNIWGSLDPAIKRWIEREAGREGCSKSLVLNTLCSYVSHIPLQLDREREPTRVLKYRKRRTG